MMYMVTGTDINPAVDDIETLMRAKIICLQKYFKAKETVGDIDRRRVILGENDRMFQIVDKNTEAWQ